LLKLASPDLTGRMQSAMARLERLRWQTTAAPFDSEQRAQWQVAQEQLSAAEAEVAAIHADAIRYEPVAPFAGVLRDVAPDLQPGAWLSKQEPLARLIADHEVMVVAYLSEDEVNLVSVGDGAKFYADTPEGPVIPLEVAAIDRDASRTLPEPELANLFGGGIVAREKNGQFYPERPLYRVTLKALSTRGSVAQHTWRGTAVISGKWTVPGWRYLRGALAVMRREAGF